MWRMGPPISNRSFTWIILKPQIIRSQLAKYKPANHFSAVLLERNQHPWKLVMYTSTSKANITPDLQPFDLRSSESDDPTYLVVVFQFFSTARTNIFSRSYHRATPRRKLYIKPEEK